MRCLVILIFLLALGALGAGLTLDNPSFEVPGSDGLVFGGWDQFGQTAAGTEAYHGSAAARLSGPNNGSISVSGFWQQLDCQVNEQWEISGKVMITAAAPLTGSCLALLNVEWRNAAGGLISYDSFAVADPGSPVGRYLAFQRTSSPAPAGTVAMRVVLGVLQGATDPVPVVNFDQITCYGSSSPGIDEVQWIDFPGGRSMQFSGRTWRVKGPGFYGPGPNNFSDLPQSVWVDTEDRLHMTISYIDSAWRSTELTLADTLGYGDYIFTTLGALDQLDLRTVLGLFIWQYSNVWEAEDSWWNPYNEVDIEYSRWGTAGNEIGQFVAQPWDWAGNIFRYGAAFGTEELSSHAFRWLPDRVEFRSWRGGPADESLSSLISSWVYTGPHIPRPEQPRVHINLWYFGNPPSAQQEVVLSRFTYVTPGGVVEAENLDAPALALNLQQNWPNPFELSTTIKFSLEKTLPITLEVFDIRGRKVASLIKGVRTTGEHSITWSAEDLPCGVYLYRLSSDRQSVSSKMLLLK